MHHELSSAEVWVVDASVVVEYLVAIAFPEQATAVFRNALHLERELWAPDLVYAESLSALRRLVAQKALKPAAGARASQQLGRLPLAVSGTARLVEEIWSLRTAYTAYDACYVALARKLDAPLITADGKLARAIESRRGQAIFLGDVSPAR
jgi:predicted nucleic acid-binding protein